MKLVELVLQNFKRFADFRLEFIPGLNLIYGPNESGKSTIHEAICCALFGRERGKALESWNGGKCCVTLTYAVNGEMYRIERRITELVSRLGTVNGNDLANIITDKNEIEQTVAEHIGISSPKVFNNTVSVQQLDLSKLDTSEMDAVGSEIQRVLTGTANVSAAEALRRLEARQRDIKGHHRPANPREYDRITNRLTELANEVAAARQSRTRIKNLSEELDELETKVADGSQRLAELERLLDKHKRWAELKKSEADTDSAHKSVYSNLRKIQDTVNELNTTQKSLETYTDLVGKDEEIANQLSKIEIRHKELETHLLDLESSGDMSVPATERLAQAGLLTGTLTLLLAGLLAGIFMDIRWLMLMIPGAILAIAYLRARRASKAVGFERLSGIIESTRKELQQLDAEKANILNYITCASVEEAWNKIKSYRTLNAKAQELEITLKTLLNGQKPEDWEEQERELARQLSTIRVQLEGEFADYAPTTQEVESWRSEHASLRNSVPTFEARLHEVRGALATEKLNARDLAALEGEIEYLHTRKNELELLHKAYTEAINALQAVIQNVSQEFLPTLSDSASGYFKEITQGRYTNIQLGQGWNITVSSTEKPGIDPPALSVGTVDQLYFALRMACGELLSGNKRLPLILDDPFATFDRGRLDRALDMLTSLSKQNQVILFTHNPYIAERIRATQDTLVHELPPA